MNDLLKSSSANAATPAFREADKYLTAASVRARYGAISDMTVYRWLRDSRVAFPAPIYIGRRRYWSLIDLVAWEHDRANREDFSRG